jgi:signal transduction histidine kinase
MSDTTASVSPAPDDIRELSVFIALPADELQWLLDHSREVQLATGDFFIEEHQAPDRFYVVLEGELQITRTIDNHLQVLGTTPQGIMGGEGALLNNTPSPVSSRALMPTRLLVWDSTTFRQIFATCPVFGSRILQTTAERTQGFASIIKQQEKMAALGRLSAGLAHELNNPAAAARRAARSLQQQLPTVFRQTMLFTALGLSAGQIDQLLAFQQRASDTAARSQSLPPLEQSDREDELADWLDGLGVADGWDLAPAFVSAGLTRDDLALLIEIVPPSACEAALGWLRQSLEAVCLLDEIEQSTRRMSDLVGAVKSYTYMDRARLQEVDIHADLEVTLKVLQHKLKSLTVKRTYDPELPRIQARGSELNQVWTNLIDNAADAMGGSGTIELVTRCENTFVMVEIADNGPGIPRDVLPRVFEPFYTTKEVGVGTGLGLDISLRIIQQHNGTIEVQSQPGYTRFIIRLPISSNLAETT